MQLIANITSAFLLPHSEDHMILSIYLDRVPACDGRTDRQTDGIAVANTVLCVASNVAVP